MEEKKNVVNENAEKLSYEQLENVCHQLSEQTRVLYQRLQDANTVNAYKRLDYLFEVVNKAEMFPKEFVDKSVAEIIEAITIPAESNTEVTE